jgi:hypothetical protein
VTPPQEAPAFDAFLSYHSGDGDWVAALKAALESKGIRVWLDTEQIRPGDLFPGALARAVGAVRCVIIVLSPGSVASAWVEEEYNLALAHRRQVIPALIDDVEPPGFLAGRSWVDFRDEGQFQASLEQLIFGITGRRSADAGATEVGDYRDTPPASDGTDEAEVLRRLIDRRRQDARRLWRTRGLSAMLGLAIGAIFFVVGSDATLRTRIGVCLLSPLILLLAAWGVTATGLTRLGSKVEQFEVLRDGLEACRSRSHPGCRKLRQRFWDMMTHIAGDASGTAGVGGHSP